MNLNIKLTLFLKRFVTGQRADTDHVKVGFHKIILPNLHKIGKYNKGNQGKIGETINRF